MRDLTSELFSVPLPPHAYIPHATLTTISVISEANLTTISEANLKTLSEAWEVVAISPP